MSQNLQVTPLALILSFSIVIIAYIISKKNNLDLTKDITIAVIRVILQLLAVGYILDTVFQVNNLYITLASIAIIIFNSSWNAAGHGKSIPHPFLIALFSISVSMVIVLMILILSKSLQFIPSQVIPIAGMIAGQAMMGVSLIFSNLNQTFKDQSKEIIEMLALGATPTQASQTVKKMAIKNGMLPSIDSIKTTGIVTLPGMMSGLILAGINPIQAIMYQIMISFIVIGTISITTFLSSSLACRSYFNERYQLILK